MLDQLAKMMRSRATVLVVLLSHPRQVQMNDSGAQGRPLQGLVRPTKEWFDLGPAEGLSLVSSQSILTVTVRIWEYSCMACRPFSRPMPLVLNPPKGVSMPPAKYSLT